MKSTNAQDMNTRLVNHRNLFRVTLSIILFVLIGFPASAQDAPKSFMDDPVNHPMAPLYLVTALLFVTLILVMVVAVYMLRILNLFERIGAAIAGEGHRPGPRV